jgi:hypothetical protein
MAPQALEKGAGFLPSPFELPERAANMVVNGIDLGGSPGVGQESQKQPYNPNFTTSNPRLQKLLHDPRMRNYLTNVIQQMETK